MSQIGLEGIVLRLGGEEVLTDISLEVGAGEVMALVGPSAAGKSSVLRVILGLVAPDRGTVWLAGQAASADGRIIRPCEERNLAVVFQDLALWPHLTVEGNLGFGLAARRVPRDQQRARIGAVLARVGLRDKANRYPGDLSGGERQRVAIARALVLAPEAVLLDEPLGNVDVALKRELVALFRELLRERGLSAIYVTHEPREAAALADRIAVLERGRIVQAGTIDELAAQPATPFVRAVVEDLAYGVPPQGGRFH